MHGVVDRDVRTPAPPRSEAADTRRTGLLLVVSASAVGALVALPVSFTDHQLAGSEPQTVYPLMLLPTLAVVAVAGLVAATRPVTAGLVAVAGAIHGLQLAGIALVASRDWLNYAGIGQAGWERGQLGSRLALLMLALAVAVVVPSVKLYRRTADRGHRLRPQRGLVLAGRVVAVALPILACLWWQSFGVAAVVQFVLWWSLPWGAGLIAAGTLSSTAQRRTALASVALSVAITVVCAAVAP